MSLARFGDSCPTRRAPAVAPNAHSGPNAKTAAPSVGRGEAVTAMGERAGARVRESVVSGSPRDARRVRAIPHPPHEDCAGDWERRPIRLLHAGFLKRSCPILETGRERLGHQGRVCPPSSPCAGGERSPNPSSTRRPQIRQSVKTPIRTCSSTTNVPCRLFLLVSKRQIEAGCTAEHSLLPLAARQAVVSQNLRSTAEGRFLVLPKSYKRSQAWATRRR